MALRELEDQIRVLQKRQGDIQSAVTDLQNAPVPLPVRGTTAERDAAYGVPSTDAERVALANQRLTYWNVELGWEESYYAVTGRTGLTARGLQASTPSGWYPTSAGPRGVVYASGSHLVGNGQYFFSYADFGVAGLAGKSWRNSTLIQHSSQYLYTTLAGVYEIKVEMGYQDGAGTTVGGPLIADGYGNSWSSGKAVHLTSGYGSAKDWVFPTVTLLGGSTSSGSVCYLNSVGTLNIGYDVARMSMTYVGPAFASL